MNNSGKGGDAPGGREGTLSKARPEGQANRDRFAGSAVKLLKWAALPLIAALCLFAPAQAAERTTPSSLPVPRYVTLKFGEVNARAGPGDDHRLMWVYRARGLPLQVVAETREWRRVCDPRGALAWVHKRTVDGRRTVMGGAAATAIRAKPKAGSRVVAYLRPRSLAALDRCEKGWCKVKAGRARGWIAARSVWGATEAPQCR